MYLNYILVSNIDYKQISNMIIFLILKLIKTKEK